MAGLFSRLVKNKGKRHFIAVDFGSDSAIRSLLIDQKNGESIAVKKQHYELSSPERAADAAEARGRYLHALVFNYIKTAGRVPDEMIVGLGGRFERSEVVRESRPRKDPRKTIDAAEVMSLLSAYAEKNSEKNDEGDHWHLVSMALIQSAVDGYAFNTSTERASGERLEATFFATFLARRQWGAVNKLRSSWGGINIELISIQYAVAQAVAECLGVKNAVIIKIGSEATEVSLLENGQITFAGKAASGGEEFTMAIAKQMAVSRNYAERIKRQWGKVLLPARTGELIKEKLNSAADSWVSKVAGLLRKEKGAVLPASVFVLGGGAELGIAIKAVSQKPWHEDLTFHQRLEVRKLSAEDLAPKIFRNITPMLNGPGEAGLTALVFVLQSLKSGEENIVQKLRLKMGEAITLIY